MLIIKVDDILGELVSLLKQRGLWDNLLFVVSSDSGGPISVGANNYPLKGGKMTDWQGVVRVNAFVSGGYLPTTGQLLEFHYTSGHLFGCSNH